MNQDPIRTQWESRYSVTGLPPIIDENSKVIILGTLPDPLSLKNGEYYSDETPRSDRFWKIIYGLFGQKPAGTYEERVQFLKDKHIAIWDVLHSARRPGFSNADISRGKPNDFASLFANYPTLRCVAFNGNDAVAHFTEHAWSTVPKAVKLLPVLQSSGSNRKKVDALISDWKRILPYLRDERPST